MIGCNYSLDHIGIAVNDLNSAVAFYENSFENKILSKEILDDKNLEIVFLSANNTKIELLSPTAKGKIDPNNPIQKFLSNKGSGLHHICYKVLDIEKELLKLKSLGLILIDQMPRTGAYNTKIAFLHPKSCFGTLIELCEHQ